MVGKTYRRSFIIAAGILTAGECRAFRMYSVLLDVGRLARLANAQESRVGVEAAFGVGIVSAQSPYRTDLAATGRLGVVVRSRNGRSAEVSGLLLGAFGAGDSFGEPPIPRPVPNTVALSVGCLCRIGASPWTSSIGLGAYHVASRASAPGGTSIGLHGGLQRVVARTAFGSVLVERSGTAIAQHRRKSNVDGAGERHPAEQVNGWTTSTERVGPYHRDALHA
jgi:hypothetical protein